MRRVLYIERAFDMAEYTPTDEDWGDAMDLARAVADGNPDGSLFASFQVSTFINMLRKMVSKPVHADGRTLRSTLL
jgi:hypothetical protein